jgi:hypothetical protein
LTVEGRFIEDTEDTKPSPLRALDRGSGTSGEPPGNAARDGAASNPVASRLLGLRVFVPW